MYLQLWKLGVRKTAIIVVAVAALLGTLAPSAAFAAAPTETLLTAGHQGNKNFRNKHFNRSFKRKTIHRPSNKFHSKKFDGRFQKKDSFFRKPVSKKCSVSVKVRKGDTLSGIAKHFRVSEHSLAKDNGIKNPNRVYAGQSLCIR